MTKSATREDRVLDVLQQRYEERGFTFFKYPPRDLLPTFLGNYLPDAIALGKDENIAIEVKSRADRDALIAGRIADLFRGQKKWRFRACSC